VKFDVPSATPGGRVIFSSYHTLESTSMTVDPTAPLSPQERILEYLMFEAGSCVGPVS
jgi:hypothetical protein